MRLPDEIAVQVLADGKPVANILVSIKIVMPYKNNFLIVAGPTDAKGRCVISRAEMLDQINITIEYAIMDYHHPETAPASEIIVRAFGLAELRAAADDYRHWPYSFPPWFTKSLKKAYRSLRRIGVRELEVEVVPIGGGIPISAAKIAP